MENNETNLTASISGTVEGVAGTNNTALATNIDNIVTEAISTQSINITELGNTVQELKEELSKLTQDAKTATVEEEQKTETDAGDTKEEVVVETETTETTTETVVEENTTTGTDVNKDLEEKVKQYAKEIEEIKKQMTQLRKANEFTSSGNSNQQNNKHGKSYSDEDILNFRWKI